MIVVVWSGNKKGAWRRPTLPPLERQYHWRRGISLPSSGWDRVLWPSPWPPGFSEGRIQRSDIRSWAAPLEPLNLPIFGKRVVRVSLGRRGLPPDFRYLISD